MVRREVSPCCFIPRTTSTASSATRRLFAQVSGACSVEENTILSMAVSAVMSSSPDSTKPENRRYVVAPIKDVEVPAPSSSSQAKYSGPPIPHKPGQPSAEENPSNEVMTSTMSSGMSPSTVVVP